MSFFPVLTDVVPCTGTCCNGHAGCPHYQAMEGSDPFGPRMATCHGTSAYALDMAAAAAKMKSATVPA